ncbi:hypothetical protein D3C72_1826280 [compost metagenome]
MRPMLLILPLLLSACAPATMAPASVEPGVTVVADLTVRDEADRRVLATVTPWAATHIVNAVVTLHPETGDTVLAQTDFSQADIVADRQVKFGNLKHNTKYRIVVTAFAADGDDLDTDPDPIHDTDVATCTTAFETTTDDVVTLTDGIQLKLRNKVFSGSTTNTLEITGGGLTDTGTETVTLTP